MSVLSPLYERSESLTERVYESIRQGIVSRALAPGGRITEASLAEQLSVSKTPVREALLRLEQVGLIESDPGRGARVVNPSAQTIREAYEVREGLEVEAVRLTAKRADHAAAAAIEAFARQSLAMASSGDSYGFQLADRSFHIEIARSSSNTRLSRAVQNALDLAGALRSRDVIDTHNSISCAQHHVDISRAIQTHRQDDAEQIMRLHLGTVQDIVVRAFAPQSASAVPNQRVAQD